MTWAEKLRELTALPSLLKDDRYELQPTKEGAVVKCETCSQVITKPDDRFCDIADEVFAHEELMHR